MKKLIAFTFALLFAASLTQAQESTSYSQTLKEMFAVSGTENTYKSIIGQMFGMFQQQYPQVDSAMWQELEGEFMQASLNDLADMLVPVYQKHLTEEDLKAVIAFYATPTGQKFAQKTPLITQESMQIGQAWGQQIAQDFVKKMEDRGYK